MAKPCAAARPLGWSRAQPLPNPQPRKSTPAPLAGLQCRPLQAKGKACVKNIAISKFHRRGEHCSPAKALCCRKAPRVEQSPALTEPTTPKIRPRTIGGPAMQAPTSKRFKPRHKNTPNRSYYIVGAGLGSARVCRTLAPCVSPRTQHRTPPPTPQQPTPNS